MCQHKSSVALPATETAASAFAFSGLTYLKKEISEKQGAIKVLGTNSTQKKLRKS